MKRRKIVVSMMVSLDGYVEAPDPTEYWHNWNEEMDSYMMSYFETVDTFIYGRKSYEEMLEYWPAQSGEFADVMNLTPKLVFSRSLQSLEWNSILLDEIDPDNFRQVLQEEGKDLVIFAGPDLIRSFRTHDLIDEYRLIINPLILGGGKKLFQDVESTENLKLISSRQFDCGNILLIYTTTNR
jgi:dihydrofolate reductase